MTVLTILTVIAMVFAPLIARLFVLDTTRYRAHRGAPRDDHLHALVPAADAVLRLHRAGHRAAQRAIAASSRPRSRPSSTTSIVIGVLIVFARQHRGRARRLDRRPPHQRRRGHAHAARRGHHRRHRGDGARAPPRAATRSRPLPCRVRLAAPRRAQDAAAVGLDDRLRRHEPGRVVVRARAREERRTGNVSAYLYAYAFFQVPHGLLAVSIMTTMMPEFSRSFADARLRRARVREFRVGLRYLLVLDAARGGAVHRARAADARRAGARRVPAHDARSRPTRCRCSRSASCRSPCTSTRCAASTRCRTRSSRSGSTRSRTASTSCSRSRCSRRSACRASRSRGAVRTSSPRCSRSSCCGREVPHPIDRQVLRSTLRAVIAARRARDRRRRARGAIGQLDGQPRRSWPRRWPGIAGGSSRYVVVLALAAHARARTLIGVLRRRTRRCRRLAGRRPSCGATCNHGPFATDRTTPNPRRSHGRSRRDRQCL